LQIRQGRTQTRRDKRKPMVLSGGPRLFSGSLLFAACFWSFHTWLPLRIRRSLLRRRALTSRSRNFFAISIIQTAILLAIAVILGQWAARKLGLGTPLIAALLAGRSVPERSLSRLLIALALGVATALALMMLDRWIFAPIPTVAELIHNVENGSARPNTWQGFLASFYGAVTEEILMRLGFAKTGATASQSGAAATY
jgi:hypothetical protein